MLLSQLYMQAPDPDLVLKWYRSASDELSALVKDDPNRKVQPDFQNQWHTLSWNISIFLLRRTSKEGWSLYDHGLRVHAEGKRVGSESFKTLHTPIYLFRITFQS